MATGRAKPPGWRPRRSATSTTTTSRPGSASASRRRSRSPTSDWPTSATGSGSTPRTAPGRSASAWRSSAGNELYVATVGPAEAYLIRQARLSTLPDPHRDRGLPTGELEPDVWRGELSVGDSLVLVSPNLVAKLGTDELKDAMVTLHPQSAIEHLHRRFVAADGTGSDGAIAFEATEVASTHKQRTLVPVRPAEPLAGAPDRGPIPLADSVGDGVAAMQAGARQARTAAGTGLARVVSAESRT